MARILIALCAFVFLLHPGLSRAAVNETDKQLIQTLMRKSGLDKQLEQIPAMVQAEVEQTQQQQKVFPQSELPNIKRLVAVAFDSKALNNAVRAHIQTNMTGKDIEAALARVTAILIEHRDQLEKLADALVSRETLEDSEIRLLLGFPPREQRA